MFYTFSIIFIIFIVHHFLIPFSNANISEVEDQLLFAIMKGHQEMQLSEYSKQKYEAYLGIVYYMKNNWQCDKIKKKFEEYERTECQKYRKYLNILYEYLRREYAEIPTVKPKFELKNRIEINGPTIYVVNILAEISQFYFESYGREYHKYKLDKFFDANFKLKLLNEERLNYDGIKLSINEMILQLAIDTANEWQTNESLDGIILQNCGEKFDENLKEMVQKADNAYGYALIEKFGDKGIWNENALFDEFVIALATTNFVKFFQMAKQYGNYLDRTKKKLKPSEFYGFYDWYIVGQGIFETEKMDVHLTQKFEAHFGTMYLLREKWQFSYIFDNFEWKICKNYGNFLNILYEYAFQLYVEAKNPKVSKQLPPLLVKPIFKNEVGLHISLIKFIILLKEISKRFEKNDENTFYEIKLVNEEELKIYEIKEKKNITDEVKWSSKLKQNILKKINGPKKVQKKGKKILNLSNEIEDNLREEFDQKMRNFYENIKRNANEEMA